MLLAGCSTLIPQARGIQHALAYVNGGDSAITDVRIRYGEYVLPSGSLSYRMGSHSRNADIRTIPIPREVIIEWESSDGVPHMTRCSLLFKRTRAFHGFEFNFNFHSVDVEILESVSPDPFVGVKHTVLCSFTAH